MAYKDREKQREYQHLRYLKNRDELIIKQREYNRRPEVKQAKKEWAYKNGINKPMNENKKCSLFLGVFIAERALSKVFKNVKRMKSNYPGFDFICNKGYKIDVKSSTLRYGAKTPRWCFEIEANQTPDYFLCIGFDNREDLNPLKLWLIPGNVINNKKSISISNIKHSLQKWKQYELDDKLEKVITCCNAFKSEV